jgi:hypothetical protein
VRRRMAIVGGVPLYNVCSMDSAVVVFELTYCLGFGNVVQL